MNWFLPYVNFLFNEIKQLNEHQKQIIALLEENNKLLQQLKEKH